MACVNGLQWIVPTLVHFTMLLRTKTTYVKITPEFFHAKIGIHSKWITPISLLSSRWHKLASKDLMPLLSGFKPARVLWMAQSIMEVYVSNKRLSHLNGLKVQNFQISRIFLCINGLSLQTQIVNRRSSTELSKSSRTLMY